MAKATKNLPPRTYTVTLELSQNEAETLYIVTRHIGGPSEITRRGFMDAIGDALRDAGVKAVDFKLGTRRAIDFLEETL